MSGAEAASELASGVALPPPDDEFVSRSGSELQMEGDSQSNNATLSGRYDSYEGVIVDPRSLPSDGSTFKKSLMASIAEWKREVKSLATPDERRESRLCSSLHFQVHHYNTMTAVRYFC